MSSASSSSGGHFHRRWGSASSSGTRRSPSTSALSSTVEPSTYGTSWNSVRWNKPVTPGYRSQSSRIAASFEREKPSYYISSASTPRRESVMDKYSTPAAKAAANLASLGAPVSTRASRFDSTISENRYRSEARDLISKYTSKERPTTTGGYYSRHFEPQKLTVGNETYTSPASSYSTTADRDYGYRKSASTTPTRTTVPSTSRYSESRSITSPTRSAVSPGPIGSAVRRQERPWRQRMAEGARVRALHGEDVSASYLASRASRRSSIGRENDDLSSSLSALRDYVAQPAGYRSRTSSTESRPIRSASRESIGMPMSSSLIVAARKELADVEREKKMSRSYSPVRSKESLVSGSPRFPSEITELLDTKLGSSVESISRERNHVSVQPKDESIKEEDVKEKRNGVRERSEARILSRHNSHARDSSDEEDPLREKEEARKKRRESRARKSMTREGSQLRGAASPSDRSLANDADTSKSLKSPTAKNVSDEDSRRSNGPLSPRMGGKLSKSASAKKMVPTKIQSIRSPCVVEAGGPPVVSPLSPASGPLSPISINLSFDEISGDTDEAPAVEDESQYNAVTSFKPVFKPKVKPLKPVPGSWKKDASEENISKNKTLDKPSESAATAIAWKTQYCSLKKSLRVKSKAVIKKEKEALLAKQKEAEKKAKEAARLKKEEEKKKKEKKEKLENLSQSFVMNRKEIKGTATKTLKDSQRLSVSSPQLREKKPKPVVITVDLKLDDKIKIKKNTAKCEKTIKAKSAPTSSTVSLQCSSSSTSECNLKETIKAKNGVNSASAKVHVVHGPVDGVNMSKVRLRVRAAAREAANKRQSLPNFSEILANGIIEEEEEKRHSLDVDDAVLRSSSERDTRAAAILADMRLPRRSSQDSSSFLVNDPTGPLVLPDKSILEAYVKRKRGKLEELRGAESFGSSFESALSDRIECDSPCGSTCSDLLPAPEVRICTHSPRHAAQITTPSRLSSVEASTPTAMLDTIQSHPHQQSSPQPASYTTPGFLRHGGKAVTLTAKPLPFDTPKTPFEATLQNHALRIRKASLVHQDSNASSTDEGSMQRSSGLVNSFTASVNANQPRHERYAAHLPHRTGDHSGRTSAASLDSTNSGTLDAASKHVDNMIDQARYRHQAHRSKFKEAIDYLDNIFEDLKKEVDTSGPSTANASPGPSRHVRKTSANSINGSESNQHGVAAALQREAQQKERRNGTNNNMNGSLTFVPSTSAPSHSNSLPNRSQRHRQPLTAKEPSPVEISLRPVAQPSNEDLEVSETLVLPKKTDKLDFTRRWLHDDLSGFTKSPPQLIDGPTTSMYTDADEHSLGSCSAEVAAINNSKQKKRRDSKPKVEKPTIVVPNDKRLAPYRPQPVYGQPNGSRFPVEVDTLAPNQTNSLSRVASYDRLSERLQSRHSDVWRSGSQEPYQTLGSVRSDDGSRPSPSAFQNVPYQRGGMRGSIRSLPDAGLVIKQRTAVPSNVQVYYPEQTRDPAMAIDALVAELELNTDQNGNATDKRRSFPTSSMGTIGRQARVVPATTAPVHQARYSQPSHNQQPHHNQYQQQRSIPQQMNQPKMYQQPQPVQSSRSSNGSHRAAPTNHVAALDEVTNMLHTVSEFGSSEKPKKNGTSSSSAPFAPLNSSSTRPFDTINQERINPSRVEAIQSMFENRRGSGPGYDWRVPGKKNSHEEEGYFDLSEFSNNSNQIKPRPSPPPHRSAVIRHSPHSSSIHSDIAPPSAFPSSQPPSGPPPLGRNGNGSAGSSQNGGYYSSNSSCAVGPTTSYQQNSNRRDSLVGRQSIGSRAASIDDEDDGFYDNIGIYGNGSSMNDRRYSRGSELGDTVSMSSSRLPPTTKPTRIGSFLSKIGARSNGASLMRPPGTAASLVSLNKVAVEAPIHHVSSLTKSTSLSNDPWRKEVIEGGQGKRNGSTGLGARLKNSLFGSKKRLN